MSVMKIYREAWKAEGHETGIQYFRDVAVSIATPLAILGAMGYTYWMYSKDPYSQQILLFILLLGMLSSAFFLHACRILTEEEAVPESTEEGPAPESTEEGPAPESTEEGPAPESTEEGPAPESTEEGPAPESTEEGPAPESTEEGPAPESTEEGPAPESTEEGPAPESTEEGPAPESTEEGPAPEEDKENRPARSVTMLAFAAWLFPMGLMFTIVEMYDALLEPIGPFKCHNGEIKRTEFSSPWGDALLAFSAFCILMEEFSLFDLYDDVRRRLGDAKTKSKEISSMSAEAEEELEQIKRLHKETMIYSKEIKTMHTKMALIILKWCVVVGAIVLALYVLSQ